MSELALIDLAPGRSCLEQAALSLGKSSAGTAQGPGRVRSSPTARGLLGARGAQLRSRRPAVNSTPLSQLFKNQTLKMLPRAPGLSLALLLALVTAADLATCFWLTDSTLFQPLPQPQEVQTGVSSKLAANSTPVGLVGEPIFGAPNPTAGPIVERWTQQQAEPPTTTGPAQSVNQVSWVFMASKELLSLLLLFKLQNCKRRRSL